ncbi:efflux RND transporter periplasmic adaptor subunit [Marichromatium bheemlicum]|uniref:Efflux RND transporter periplasmic adaptor subunit n=1 Tax=Marichromatium bheemlicum TaxID=365339 RepID=A0ABX1I6V4_9GAMM|nr:efflux RND transporter periplasmic adaptor subunit [Marichromatium bheemlicum]NKN31896.1 efflux RND transporter periplasmic adaptor subunit [Marichromatium bheemlicum]
MGVRPWPLLPALLVLAGCKTPSVPAELPVRPIAWTRVETASGEPQRWLAAVVRAVRRAPLSFEVGGRVELLEVEVGERFAAGALLGRLDARLHRLVRAERVSEVAEAEARLHEAERAFVRQRELHGRDWASQAAFDSAEAALGSARARLETARARLALAVENLSDTELYAPYAGVVTRRLAEPAQRVAAGETVLEIQGDDHRFEIALTVPETLIGRLEHGSIHRVRVPARPGLTLEARVAEIGAEGDAGGTFPVTLRLLEPCAELRTGMTAEVVLVADTMDGVGRRLIPVSAFLVGEGDERIAFVFRGEGGDEGIGTLERRSIELGAVGAGRVLVRAGLGPDEIVATHGLTFLRAGQRVSLLGVGARRYD